MRFDRRIELLLDEDYCPSDTLSQREALFFGAS